VNAVSALGAASLLTALATAGFAMVAPIVGAATGRAWLARLGRRSLAVTAVFMTLAVLTLAYALLTDDFSIAYVAGVSSREMETPFKLSALYSSQAGSLLFWSWMTSMLLAACALFTLPRMPWGATQATAVGGAVVAAFLVPLIFVASPFRVNELTAADGVGLNPLLVDPGMLIHPPFLLSGLASTAVPFTLGAAALLAGRIDGAWLRAARPWALLSFLVLSVGNILGGWWAYTVLGWGGYWGWDPVENSAILPLLPVIAFLHSTMVQERRGMLKLWNLALVLAAFALAVFGTFNVRSGLVDSVHSFAQSDIGPYFLTLLGITTAGAVGLLVWRSPQLRPDHEFESLASRETGLILNNYLLTAIVLVVLGGTLFPVFAELVRGTRVTVGPPFYNDVVGPLLVALLALTVIGTVLPWRRAAPATLRRRFVLPVAVTIVAIVVLAAFGMRDPFALAGTAMAITLAAVTLREYGLGTRGVRRATGRNWPGAFLALFGRDHRRYGGYLVHLGLAVMAIAVIGSTIYQEQVRTVLPPGERFEVGPYTVRYDGLRERPGVANGIETEIVAVATVFEGDREIATLYPGRRFFSNFPEQPVTIVDLRTTLRDDLYLFVQGWDANANAEFHAFVNPLLVWLWIGAAVYVAGGLIAFAPQRAPLVRRVDLAAPNADAGSEAIPRA